MVLQQKNEILEQQLVALKGEKVVMKDSATEHKKHARKLRKDIESLEEAVTAGKVIATEHVACVGQLVPMQKISRCQTKNSTAKTEIESLKAVVNKYNRFFKLILPLAIVGRNALLRNWVHIKSRVGYTDDVGCHYNRRRERSCT